MHPELYRAIIRARGCPHTKPSTDPLPPGATSVELIRKAICRRYKIPVDVLCSNLRHAKVSRPRMIAYYLADKHTWASFADIGRLFGNRNHATIIKGKDKIARLLASDAVLAGEIAAIERELGVS